MDRNLHLQQSDLNGICNTRYAFSFRTISTFNPIVVNRDNRKCATVGMHTDI